MTGVDDDLDERDLIELMTDDEGGMCSGMPLIVEDDEKERDDLVTVELVDGREVEMTVDELTDILRSEGVTMLGLQAEAWGSGQPVSPSKVVREIVPRSGAIAMEGRSYA